MIWRELERQASDAKSVHNQLSRDGSGCPTRSRRPPVRRLPLPRRQVADEDDGAYDKEREDNSVVVFRSVSARNYGVQLKLVEFLQYDRFLISRSQPCLNLRGLR